MEKKEAFEFLGITKFHDLGYTGSRVKIMSDEKILENYRNADEEKWKAVICPKGYQKDGGSWHGSAVMNILQDICPDATYIAFPMDMKGTGENYSSKCIEYILENNVHLFTTSSTGGICSKAKEKAMQDCIDNGTTFFCAAGNKDYDGMVGEAKSEKHIAIGALMADKRLKWANYSSIGKELDYVSIGFYGFGTSYTTPTFCAMCGLLQDFFIAKTGRALNRTELIDFINDHLIDVEDEGFDIKTGHGLFVLPDPLTINISRYVPEYGGSVDYSGFPEVKEDDEMKRVFIGVGHGGKDSGAVGNGLQEKDINLTIALACCDELVRHGVSVQMSRLVDEDDPVSEETKEANDFEPHVAVDIHTNSGASTADGFEAFAQSKSLESKELAKCIEEEVIAIGQNSRGVKILVNNSGNDYYAFLRNVKTTAVITECAFITNKNDIAIVDEKEEQKAFGIAYAKGILKYLGIAYKETEEEEMRYANIEQVPDWGKATIQKLIDKGFLAGTGNSLDLSLDMIRIFVINDKAGLYDK